MHDKHGNEITTGDKVWIEFEITETFPGAEMCNVQLKSVDLNKGGHAVSLTCDASQTQKPLDEMRIDRLARVRTINFGPASVHTKEEAEAFEALGNSLTGNGLTGEEMKAKFFTGPAETTAENEKPTGA